MSEFTSWNDFLSRGLLPEAGPLQPPEGRPRLTLVPREPTHEEKLQILHLMALGHYGDFWLGAVREAVPESDSYDWFLLTVTDNKPACDRQASEWARATMVRSIENVLKQRGETWRDYL